MVTAGLGLGTSLLPWMKEDGAAHDLADETKCPDLVSMINDISYVMKVNCYKFAARAARLLRPLKCNLADPVLGKYVTVDVATRRSPARQAVRMRSPDSRTAMTEIYPRTGNGVLDRLPAEELKKVLDVAKEQREFHFLTKVYEQDRPIREVTFLTSGVASQIFQLSDGHSTEVNLIGNAELLGIGRWLGEYDSRYEVVMQVAGAGYVLPAETFLGVAQECPYLQSLMRWQAATSIRAISQLVACNTTHSARERLARWLMSMHVRGGGRQFAMTHELLSVMLGVRRPTVSVIAAELREAGAIDYRRGAVSVANPDLLRSMECECGDVIDADYRKRNSGLVAAPSTNGHREREFIA